MNPVWQHWALQTVPDGSNAMEYPHRGVIESSLGSTYALKAEMDPVACRERNTPAFTDDQTTYFSTANPPLHIAAHEAAHQLQHAGVTRDLFLGAEGHANAIADSVVGRRDSSSLLAAKGNTIAKQVRHYADDASTIGKWSIPRETNDDVRIADNGRAVTNHLHLAYAKSVDIVKANLVLDARNSGIALELGDSSISGPAPDGSGTKTLTKIEVVRKNIKIGSDEFWEDCGRAAREVLGPPSSDKATWGVFKMKGKRTTANTVSSRLPDEIWGAILYKAGYGSSPKDARAHYDTAMGGKNPIEKATIAAQYGFDEFADPHVGEAFVTSGQGSGLTSANFHWAAVIMEQGSDKITFESFIRGQDKERISDKWYFNMYGNNKPFHEEHSVGMQGIPHTFVTTSSHPVEMADIKAAHGMSTEDLIAAYKKLKHGQHSKLQAYRAELRRRQMVIRVSVVKTYNSVMDDDVYLKISEAGNVVETAAEELGDGEHHTFRVPLGILAPAPSLLTIGAYDDDTLGDVFIDWMSWPYPFKDKTESLKKDRAEYILSAKFVK